MKQRRGSALIVALVVLGVVTLISVPLYQTLAQWRVGYLKIIKREQATLKTRYEDWLDRQEDN